MTDMDLWMHEKSENGWQMPRAALWKRLPIIRRIRGGLAYGRVHRNAETWAVLGIGTGHPQQFDKWVCYGISTGQERPAI